MLSNQQQSTQQQQQQQQQQILGKPFSGAEENRQYLRAFIQTYRNLPVLWDTSLRDYTNRDKRADAYQQLVPIYRYLKRDATLEDVKKKINTLRTNYRKELKVVECARREGNVYQPRCWTFYELDFLRSAEKFLAVNPQIKTENSFILNEHTANQFLDLYGFRNASNATPSSPAPPPLPPPNITEMFHKSFGQTPTVITPQTTAATSQTSSSSTSLGGIGDGHHNAMPHYMANNSQHNNNNTNNTNNNHLHNSMKRMRAHTSSRLRTDDALTMVNDYLAVNYPEEESLARTWTHKLKRLTREQRILAEKFIGDILFEAELGTLHRGSMQLNAFEPYVRFEENTSEEPEEKSQSPVAAAVASINSNKSIVTENSTAIPDIQQQQQQTAQAIKIQNVQSDETVNKFSDYN